MTFPRSQLHVDLGEGLHQRSERATTAVLAVNVVIMVAEIAAGWWKGSMALLADGWHMVALCCGREYGLTWLDPLIGLVGAVVIGRWALTLIRRAGAVLLDAAPDGAIAGQIRSIVTAHGDELHDLHVWPIAAGRYAVAVSATPTGDDAYRSSIMALPGVAHLTLDRAAPSGRSAGPGAHVGHSH